MSIVKHQEIVLNRTKSISGLKGSRLQKLKRHDMKPNPRSKMIRPLIICGGQRMFMDTSKGQHGSNDVPVH